MSRHETARQRFSNGWLRGEDWWGDPVTDNFTKLDALISPFALSMTTPAPPIDAALGDMYIVPYGGTGLFLGKDYNLAVLTEFGWRYFMPTRGARAGVLTLGWFWFNGEQWAPEDTVVGPITPGIGTRYDVAVSVGYPAEPREIILAFCAPEAMRIPAGAAASVGRAINAPAANVTMTIRRNAVDVGTIAFVTTGVAAVIAVTTDAVFATGDLLTIHMPDVVPDDFIGYAVTLRMLLNNNGG